MNISLRSQFRRNIPLRLLQWPHHIRIVLLSVLLFITCAALHGPARADDCGPAPGGPPTTSCTADHPASIGASGPDTGAGNPINVITGNKYQREEDMPALPGVLGLEIVRHYNSAYSKPGTPNGPLGREWKLSYETELIDKFGKIQILQADGARVIFSRDPSNPSLCSTLLPANGRLSLGLQPNGKADYTWTWPSGRRLHFNGRGKLDSIVAPTGEILTLNYDLDDILIKVTDPQGRSLQLHYLDREQARAGDRFRGVQYIDSPVGRFSYEYGGTPPKGAVSFDTRILWANMVRVRLPNTNALARDAHSLNGSGTTTSAVSRLYHHEDPRFPWLLTGISIETASAGGKVITTRFATFGYDSNGMANLSTHASNVDRVTLDFQSGGTTVLSNSLGQRTVYRHAIIGGEHRLLEVRGAGCSTCGEPNVRYGYDKLGQLVETTKLNVNGEPLRSIRRELDKLGRPVRVSTVDYQNGKPLPAQWRLRLEYQGDGNVPTTITQPSVVQGKEKQTRIVYNPVGQPLSVTEVGWIPTYDGKQAAGQIQRTKTYRYATFNGRSILTRIDGPLANGKANSPLDSDVTVFEYDIHPDNTPAQRAASESGQLASYEGSVSPQKGLLTRIIAPGNIVAEVLKRDDALRPTALRVTNDGRIQLATIHYNWRGAPEDIEFTAGAMHRHTHYDYDAVGQLLAVTHPGNIHSAFEHDTAGRVNRIILPDGSGLSLTQDTEDHTIGIASEPDARSSHVPQALTRFVYDSPENQPGRLSTISDAIGRLKSYGYDDAGQVISLANALGVRSLMEYDSDGRLTRRTSASDSTDAAVLGLAYDTANHPTDITAANGIHTLRRYDDFGQQVFEADPDRGVTLYRHDAAGRLLARIDETGATTRYAYDHAGRLLAVGKDNIPNLLQYAYRGGLLVRVISTTDGKQEHATERIDNQYDEMGQLLRETRWQASVAGAKAPWLLFVTQYAYDEAGRMVRETLPDGHLLSYRFNRRPGPGAGQLEAILFDERPVVSNIVHTIMGGVTSYTMGNGARQEVQADSRGHITELRTTAEAQSQVHWWNRLLARFTVNSGTQRTLLYHQVNHYDDAGRLSAMERQLPTPNKQALTTTHDHFEYDDLNQLRAVYADGGKTTFRYDPAGNRVEQSDSSGEQHFHYATGSNWLLATSRDTMPYFMRSVWLYHPTGLPLAHLRRGDADASNARRIVYNSNKRPVAVYDNGLLNARYHYNNRGERIAKTVYPAGSPLRSVGLVQSEAKGETRYYLYQNQRLAAETDGTGRITAHYIYLYGKPVAKVEMEENTGLLHRAWKVASFRSDSDASDSIAHIYAIVTDHLGTPQEVLDEQRQAVWQANTGAFGQARLIYAALGSDGRPFKMDLRLPGQVFDVETGLHYNYYRDYDPLLGRYLAPDPIAFGDGTNPYVYVANNPLTNIDPLGLYQSDIHYYMTFFLAVAAGVNTDEARIIALAAQYIDDNPDTSPLNVSLSTGLTDEHRARLLTYHFTMVPSNIDPATGMVSGTDEASDPLHYGTPTTSSAYANIPENAQLERLYGAVATAGSATNLTNSRCTQLQFLGEYLHAFEDTFAHRNSNDVPVDLNEGIGHALYGSNPDYTYNHLSMLPLPGHFNWNTNEARTLEAEKEVFAKLATWGDASKAKNLNDIEKTLQDFNGIHEEEMSGATTEERQRGYPDKIKALQTELRVLGYTGIDITQDGAQSFDTRTAAKDRNLYLHDKDGSPLDQKLYDGTILPK